MDVREKKSQSKCHLVVQEVTQKESRSLLGFVFQGTESDGFRDISECIEMRGWDLHGKQDECLQPERKDVHVWGSVGQPAIEIAKSS